MKKVTSKKDPVALVRIAELKRLATENDGLLVPEKVVVAARLRKSPLHDCFIWDNTEAAKQYRLFQARNLIRVSIQYIDLKGEQRPVRVFVSLTPDREETAGGYRETFRVLANSEQRSQMLADALAETEVFEKKYELLTELADVFVAMRAARRKLK